LDRRKKWAATGTESGQAPEADRQKIESSIRKLKQTLDSVVIAEIPADHEKVAFGATVTVRHAAGDEESYRIVGVEEANPEQGEISWISPLAKALLARKVGDKLRFRSPAGDEELTILTVRYLGR
jgi:transcription elongation factor GreB